jgi:uncharacterized protein (TIGR03118 family)
MTYRTNHGFIHVASIKPTLGITLGITLGALALSACSSDDNKNNSSDASTGTGGGSSGGSAGNATGGSSGKTGSGGSGGSGGSSHSGGTTSSGGTDGGAKSDAGAVVTVTETALTADDGSAANLDPNLLNAWGIAINPNATGGPAFWVSSNHKGVATVYSATGKPATLVVNLRPADGGSAAAPTGQVFNTSTSFSGDKFIFSGEDGTIVGWQAGTTGVTRADRSAADAIYKGLTIAGTTAAPTLWAPNFHAGTIDVFGADYSLTATAPADPNIPAGFAPFNAQTIGNLVYVTYAMQDAAKEDDSPGAGRGYVDVFLPDGTFSKRLISGGSLNSPWGVALAPAGWGAFAGALLVGNFGDGTIQAYDANSGKLMGSLTKASGLPIAIPGLWDLKFGPKTATVDLSNTLFFTAGPGDEEHGLFGKLEIAP